MSPQYRQTYFNIKTFLIYSIPYMCLWINGWTAGWMDVIVSAHACMYTLTLAACDMCACGYLNKMVLFSLVGEGIYLEQTIPADGALVCPGELLSYTCNATGPGIAWQVGGSDLSVFNSANQINTKMQDELFTYFLIDVFPGNQSTFLSNATIQSVTSSENGVSFSCSDGSTFEFKTIMVAG